MLLLLGAVLLFTTIGSLSLFLTYYVTLMTDRASKKREPADNLVIGLQISLLLQTLVTTVGDLATLGASSSLTFVANIRSNFKLYFGLTALILLSTTYIFDREPFLHTLDRFWRCGMHPLFDNILFAAIQVLRVIWGAIMPIYNYEVMILSQIVQGTATTVFKCNIKVFFESVKIILDIFISNFQSIATWSGVGGSGVSVDNSLITNDLNVTAVVMNVQALVAKQSDITSCICDGLTDVFEFFFIWVKQPELAHAINHLVNVPISLIQGIVQTVPPWSRDGGFLRPVSHVNGALFYFGSYADQVLMKTMIHLIALFDESFVVTGLPKEFLFTIASRLGMAFVHLAWTLSRIVGTFFIPPGAIFPIGLPGGASEYTVKAFSLDKSMEHINIAIISISDIINWGLKVFESFGKFATAGQLTLPPHVYIECSLDDHDKVNQLTCGLRYGLHLIPDIIYTAWSALVELLIKSIIYQEDSFIQVLQRYDGITYPRGEEISCTYRANIDYDFTSGVCKCDPELGTYYSLQESTDNPFGDVHFDRYCGQPSLSVNVFGQIDRALTYLVGGISENVKEVATAAFKAMIDIWRVLIKAVLNIENIVSGDYFSYKVNCGYGMSSSQLRAWWNSTDNSTSLSQKFITQRAFMYNKFSIGHCDGKDQLGYMHPLDGKPRCKLVDTSLRDMMCLPTSNPDGKIVIPESGNAFMEQVSTCTTVNRAGCECNFALANVCRNKEINGIMQAAIPNSNEDDCLRNETQGSWEGTVCLDKLINGEFANVTTQSACLMHMNTGTWIGPLDPLNKCQCIRNFPDKLMVYKQGKFQNPILSQFHSADISLHLCNTFWLEPFLYYVTELSTALEDAMAIFHPAYKSNEDGSNEFCDDKVFEVGTNNEIIFTEANYNADRAVLEALADAPPSSSSEPGCTVYGTTDFICSTSMTLRSSVSIVVNELRMVVMSASKLIDGDPTGIQLSFGERLCDLSRILGSAASIFPSLIPDTSMTLDLQSGVTKLIYAGLKYPVLLLTMANRLIVFIQRLITGNIDWGNEINPILRLAIDVVNIGVNWFRLMLEGLGETINGIHEDSGDGVIEVAGFIKLGQDIFLQPDGIAVKLSEAFTKFAMQTVSVLTNAQCDGKACVSAGDYFTSLGMVIEKTKIIISLAATQILDLLFKALGPVGAFLKKLNDNRKLINGILCIVNPIGCAVDSALNPQKKVTPKSIFNDITSGVSRLFSRRRLLNSDDEPFPNITGIVFEQFDWSGTSECDLFIQLYKSHDWGTMRPLEHVKTLECVRDRVRMIELSETLNMTLPEDLIYNPERKWTLAKQFTASAMIYLDHKLGRLTVKEMLHKFKMNGIHYATFLKIFNLVRDHIGGALSFSSIGNVLETAVRSIDPDIHVANTTLGSLYRLTDATKQASVKLYKHSQRRNVGRKLGKTFKMIMTTAPQHIDITPRVPTHLYHVYDNWNANRRVPRSPSKLHARNLVLRAAGMVTDISPCSSRPDARVCINCVIVDNFLNAVIDEGISMSNYYQYVYAPVTIPSFIEYWEDDYSTAWWTDVGDGIGRALEQKSFDLNAKIISDEDQTNGTARRRLRTPASEATLRSIEYHRRAESDWNWFFFEQGWNPYVTHSNPRSSAPKVFVGFIAGGKDDYVEYFAHSLTYYVSKPFDDCPMDKMHCTANTYEERQLLITDAMYYMLYLTLLLWLTQALSDIPIFSLSLPFLPLAFVGIYFYTVYLYTYACIPSLPNCFMDDLYGYFHDTLFPSCFCRYLPGLASSCNVDNCFMCTMSTTYATCGDTVPLYTDMGIFWSVTTYLRKHYPGSLVFLYKTIPFSWIVRSFPTLVTNVEYIIGDKDLTQVEVDCLGLSYVDILLVIFIGWLGVQAAAIAVPIAIRSVQHMVTFLIMYTTIGYSMIVSLEQQTVSDLPEYKYDE